jgi:hemoglobin/transferrin/lactoferrin receptor protein
MTDEINKSSGRDCQGGIRASPKFAIGLTTTPGFTPYFIYAHGYRAPAITETLVTGVHPAVPNWRYLDVAPSPGHGANSTPASVLQPGPYHQGSLSVRFSDLVLFGG